MSLSKDLVLCLHPKKRSKRGQTKRMNGKLAFVAFVACRSDNLLSHGFTLASSIDHSSRRWAGPNGAVQQETTNVVVAPQSLERMLKLQTALQSFNSTEASELLDELSDLRDSRAKSGPAVAAFLDDLLSDIAETRVPFWAKTRFLSRFSKRARVSSLGRTLELITPPPSEETVDSSNASELEADLQRRRRRALLSLLRTLSSSSASSGGGGGGDRDFTNDRRIPAIRQIERKARQELRQSSSSRRRNNNADMLQRRPSDLETPNYTVLTQRKGFEIRSYEPFAVCSVNMAQLEQREANPKMDAAVNEPAKGSIKAFGALAGYLFGKNQEGQAMKMTTPVLTTEDKRMSFVLPSAYWKDDEQSPRPPQPLAESGVQVERVAGSTRAVVLFGGYAVKVAEKKRQLLQYVHNDKEWMVVPGATPVLAQYNDPFTPPWKRLNEVSIPVEQKQQQQT